MNGKLALCAGTTAATAFAFALSMDAGADPLPPDTTYRPLPTLPFSTVKQNDEAMKPQVMERQRALLNQRYDLSDRPIPDVIVHRATVVEGELTVGAVVAARVDAERRLDVARRDDALAPGRDPHAHRFVGVHDQAHLLEVQDQHDHVLFGARNLGKLVRHAAHPHGRDGRAREGRQQHPPQGHPHGHAIAPVHRADSVAAIVLSVGLTLDLW